MDYDSKTDRAAAAAAYGVREKGATASGQDDLERSTFSLHFNMSDPEAGARGKAPTNGVAEPPPLATAEVAHALRAFGLVEQNIFAILQQAVRMLYGTLIERVERVSALVTEATGNDLDPTVVQQLRELTTPVSPEKSTTFYELVNDLRRQEAIYAARVMQVSSIESRLKARAAASSKSE